MPIYEFKCNTCADIYEELVPMNTEGDRLACPSCGSVGARRLVSAFAAHGLENGHIAVGRKLTGGGGSESGDSAGEGAKAPAKAACGPSCGCH